MTTCYRIKFKIPNGKKYRNWNTGFIPDSKIGRGIHKNKKKSIFTSKSLAEKRAKSLDKMWAEKFKVVRC